MWGLWYIWTWVLCMGIDMSLFSFFYVLISHYINTIYCIWFLFSIVYFLLLCQKPGVHTFVDWYTGLWFGSIGPPVCFYVLPGCFHYCGSVVDFEVRDCNGSRCSFILQDCFVYPGSFYYSIWSWAFFLRSVKNFVGILIDIPLNL